MAEIQYDPACMDCRHDAVKDPDGTTWQCNGHVRAERDWLRAKLANFWADAEQDIFALTKERNAALTLAEQRGAAYDMTWREVESLREWKDKLEAEVDEITALVDKWRSGRAHLGTPATFVDQRLLDGILNACKAPSPADAAPSLDELAIEADNFARTTFPARSAESISEHLRREAVELAAAPTDAEEMADVFILLGNLVHFTGTDLNAAVVAKLAKNRARKWGKPDAHGVVEHVSEAPPSDALHATPESERACAVCDTDVCEHIAARLAPPADAATEALRIALQSEEECGCGELYCHHVVVVMRAARALVSTPAPAPSAKGEC